MGEVTTESKKAHPKPMRRREPTKPTMTAKRQPASKPKRKSKMDIIVSICCKDNEKTIFQYGFSRKNNNLILKLNRKQYSILKLKNTSCFTKKSVFL